MNHLIAIMICTFLASCGDASNAEKCYKSVEMAFPKSKIYKKPGRKFMFIVVDSTTVREVTTLNFNDTNIDGVTQFEQIK